MPRTPSGRLIVVVTGANSGIGFGICQRFLIQLAQATPPDAKPQFTPSNSHDSLDADLDYGEGLTLIMACRSKHKANAARQQLLEKLDEYISQQRQRPDYSGCADRFRDSLEVNIHLVDLSAMHSVFQFVKELSITYPYVSHLVCNAGCADFNGLDWLKAAYQIFTAPVVAFTVTDYTRQIVGTTTNDGLGFVWQCNVFAHYVMYRQLQPLLKEYHRRYSQPARVLWQSSLESTPRVFDIDDWQCLENDHSYEATKYQIDLISRQLASRSSQSHDPSTSIHHFNVHPGIAESNMTKNLILSVLEVFKLIAFYLIRWLGSPHHPINAFAAAISAVHISLVSLAFIPNRISGFDHTKSVSSNRVPIAEDNFYTATLYVDGKKSVIAALEAEQRGVVPPLKFGSQADRLGRERVGVMTVVGWEKHEKDGALLVDRLEDLYQTFLKRETEKRNTAPNGNGVALTR